MKIRNAVIISACAFLLAAPVAAQVEPVPAETVLPDTVVNVGETIRAVFDLFIVPLVGLLAGWVINIARVKFNINIEDSMRDSLQTSAKNAANILLDKLGGKLDISIDVRHPLVAEAIRYVQRNARDALAHFGITENENVIFEKIRAHAAATAVVAEAVKKPNV